MKRTARHTKEGKIAVIVGITMVAIFLCLGVGMALAKTDDRGSLGMKNNPEHGIGNEFEVKSEPVRKTKVTAAGETVTKSVYLRPGEDGQLLVEFYGEGTVDNPYQVSSPEQLDAIRVFMAGGSGPDGDFVAEKSAHYIQTNDIDLKDYIDEYYGGPGGPGWLPLGKSEGEANLTLAGIPFEGLYDGDGYQIQNLRINRPGMSEVGLFARSGKDNSKEKLFFKNIILRDVEILAGSTGASGAKSIGALVGYLDSNGVVSASAVKGDSRITGNGQRVGGLVGYSLGRIINSYSQAQVQGDDVEVGGLVGFMESKNARVVHSYAASRVLPLANKDKRGGLVGIVNNGLAASITASYYDKDIAEKSDAGKGVGLSTLEMKLEATYTGSEVEKDVWDFDHIWAIDSVGHLIDCESEDRFYLNEGYPYLRVEKEYQDLEEVVCPGEPENPEVPIDPEDPGNDGDGNGEDDPPPIDPEDAGNDGDGNGEDNPPPVDPEVPGEPEEEEKDENDDTLPVDPEVPGEPEEDKDENNENDEKGKANDDDVKDEENEEDDSPPAGLEETGDGAAEDYSDYDDYSGGSSSDPAHEITELIEIDKPINEIALELEDSTLFALSLPEDERLTDPDFQPAANYRMVMPNLSNLPGIFVWDGRSWQGIALLAGPVQAGGKEVPSVTVSTADGLLASNQTDLRPVFAPTYEYDFIDADLLTGAMDYMASRQMIRGYQASDYTYLLKADQSASRAEFLVIMLRSLGLESLLETNSEGLLTGAWYEDYVVLAEKLGFLAASSTLNPAAEDLGWSGQDWNQAISLTEARVLMSNLEALPLYQDYLTLRKILDEKGLVYQIGAEVVNTSKDNHKADYLTRGRAVEFIYQEIFSKS